MRTITGKRSDVQQFADGHLTRRGLHTRVDSWIANPWVNKKPDKMQTLKKATDNFSFPLFGSEAIAK